MTNVTVVVGAQYGSEGKGAVVAHLAKELCLTRNDLVVRVAGPNAGHTAYDYTGREWKLRAVPVAAVKSRLCQLHIAAGSEVDPIVLANEVTALDEAGHDVSRRLTVHPSATIILESHIQAEQGSGIVGRIGSTGKGIGAARADRIGRTAPTAGELFKHRPRTLSDPGPLDLAGVGELIIEGTQGYGLGLHTENYPQVTSSDCRAIDFLAMAGVSPWDKRVEDLRIMLVARAFPIRVAGNSGPLKGETSWAELGLDEERTTVTQKIRRVGAWDDDLLAEAIEANGGGNWNMAVQLAVTMVDQKFPEVHDSKDLSDAALQWLVEVQDEHEIDITYAGTGPDTMFEVHL